ncbi:DNA polymerase Y family protein [Agromyces intestinalis]|uniref:DNA polymerase Y family protein n=1 Tax=Agromyces intestinalis TaxID=2592652 RepID=A0A5C1YDW7_9MICO|nr:DNA polymerase Y family protein [Agromyces intestinalis]QEO12982.1 DNA polymerase Y family protein [Agromyces intestinalis]
MSDLARTIVLWCPDWPVLAAAREAAIDPSSPIALTAGGLVHSSSASARREGVIRGLRLREAQLRCPSVVVLAYDAALDARAFEPVVRAVEQAVPGVQVVRPGTLAMRARGPVRYYGGEDAAAQALLATVASAGVPDARVGVSDGPFAAEQAARATRDEQPVGVVDAGASAGFLAPLPVRLVVEPRVATLLQRLGVRTLGEFAALPADDVRRRFGAAGAFAHRLAAGREGTRVAPRTPPPEFAVEQEFEPPIDRVDQLAFAFRVRAEEFIDRMRASRLVCTAIRVEIDDDRGGHSGRGWLHPRWFTAADVVDRIRWQLQGSGSADRGLAAPIVRVRVVPERVDSTGNHEDGLWGGGPDERVHHGLTRVQSMLGHDAVVTAAVGGGRMLTDRQVLVPWGDRPPERRDDAPWPGSLPALAPASVFRERPRAVLLDAGGATVTVDDRGAVSAAPVSFAVGGGEPAAVRAWAGPWPVVERWWDPVHARRVHRFQVVDDDGCAWLLVRDADGWQAEARYD